MLSPPELVQPGVPKSEGRQLHAVPTHDTGKFSIKLTTVAAAGGPLIPLEQGLLNGTTSEPKVNVVSDVLLVSQILQGSAKEKSNPSNDAHPPLVEQLEIGHPEVAAE